MSQAVIKTIEDRYKKKQVVDVHSGDTVRVHQKIREGNKERIQVFQGLVIRVDRKKSHTSRITVRRIATGVGVEKSFLVHSPLIVKVEVTKRSKVRRNYLSYMRNLTGKATRLSGVEFDRESVNAVHDEKAEAEEKQLQEAAAEQHANDEAEKAKSEDKPKEDSPEADNTEASSSTEDKK